MRKVNASYKIASWFLDGIDFSEAPSSLAELQSRFTKRDIDSSTLVSAPKWEPLLRGYSQLERKGWVPLSDIASTRRGIATGANGFFLMSPSMAREKRIRPSMLVPCVGRAMDVRGRVFSAADYEALSRSNAKCLLLNLTGIPDAAERAYIVEGEADGLPARYLLANRHPWYSMEQRPPAAIWAAVFGRGDLGFVHNQAGARSLTNFHCVYPGTSGDLFARALTAALNSQVVRQGAKEHVRGYGGGLMKFEPNDLKSIQVPDLRQVRNETLHALGDLLSNLDRAERSGADVSIINTKIDDLVTRAGIEASATESKLL